MIKEDHESKKKIIKTRLELSKYVKGLKVR
jgi:hypothetical protein